MVLIARTLGAIPLPIVFYVVWVCILGSSLCHLLNSSAARTNIVVSVALRGLYPRPPHIPRFAPWRHGRFLVSEFFWGVIFIEASRHDASSAKILGAELWSEIPGEIIGLAGQSSFLAGGVKGMAGDWGSYKGAIVLVCARV